VVLFTVEVGDVALVQDALFRDLLLPHPACVNQPGRSGNNYSPSYGCRTRLFGECFFLWLRVQT